MRLSRVLGVIGRLLRYASLAFFAPLCLAMWDASQGAEEEWQTALAFLIGGVSTFVLGSLAQRGFLNRADFRRPEALGVVAGSWLAIASCAAIPYVLLGLSWDDAFFEAMSGFTTTGATIVQDFDAYGRAFFLWRSMTQWFGGLGVIALFVVVLPQLGIAGRQLMFAESSTAPNEVISSRVRESARRLWMLYVTLTITLIAMLMLVAGMEPYHAICTSLSTVSAGGFSPNGQSIAGYANPEAEWILSFFMVLAGVSFPLVWVSLTRSPLELLRDGEFRAYALVVVVVVSTLAFLLAGGLPGEAELRASTFQTASLITGTGFASTDYNLWADSLRILLIVAMLVGGCAGSAAGGPKVIRTVFAVKFVWREITRSLHPRAVLPLRHKGVAVPEPILRAVLSLVGLYLIGYMTISICLALLGTDLVTSFSAALACMGNIGPGFNEIGPMNNYSGFSAGEKVLLSLSMWIGRLEVVTVLALLHPDVWRRLRWRDDVQTREAQNEA